MNLKKRKQKIRKDRVWNHFMYWCDFENNKPFIDLQVVVDYDPNDWRDAFERYQTNGAKALSTIELKFIEPIVNGQRIKEITLNGLATESLEFWANSWGWIYPWIDSLTREPFYDRLTKVAILRTIRKMQGGKKGHYNPNSVIDYFMSHPGISEKTKQYYLNLKLQK